MADSRFLDDEEKLNASLSACDIEVEGMGLEQKRQMVLAIQLSKNTAKEEENLRSIQHVETLISEDESNSDSLKQEPCNSVDNRITQRSVLASRGTTLIVCPANKACSNSSSDTECMVIEEVKCVRTPTLSTPRISKLSMNFRVIGSIEKNKECENILLSNQKSESQNSEGSPLKPKTHTKTAADKVRNIDVWNCEKNPDEIIFPDKRQANYKPFYLRPKNMPVKNYAAHFRKHQAMLINRVAYQSKSLKFVPWGPPVDLSMIDYSEASFEKLEENISSKSVCNERYNLRTRNGNIKRGVSENSDLEGSSEDEILISKRAKKAHPTVNHPYKPKKKEPQEFSYDALIFDTANGKETENQTEEMNENSSLFTNVTNACDVNIDVNNDDISTNMGTEKEYLREDVHEATSINEGTSSEDLKVDNLASKRKGRGPAKRKNVSKPSTRGKVNCKGDNGLVKDSEGWITQTLHSVDIIKPGPVVGKKVRKLYNANSPILSKTRSKACSENAEKLVCVPDEPNVDVTSSTREAGECPICSEMFSLDLIENHADQCCESSSPALNNEVDQVPVTCHTCQKEFIQENLADHKCLRKQCQNYSRFNRS